MATLFVQLRAKNSKKRHVRMLVSQPAAPRTGKRGAAVVSRRALPLWHAQASPVDLFWQAAILQPRALCWCFSRFQARSRRCCVPAAAYCTRKGKLAPPCQLPRLSLVWPFCPRHGRASRSGCSICPKSAVSLWHAGHRSLGPTQPRSARFGGAQFVRRRPLGTRCRPPRSVGAAESAHIAADASDSANRGRTLSCRCTQSSGQARLRCLGALPGGVDGLPASRPRPWGADRRRGQ